jgi:hypothetical protein
MIACGMAGCKCHPSAGAPRECLVVPANAGTLRLSSYDNGVPFASPNALFNLSKLSVWWLRLGINIERIRPGHPPHAQKRNHAATKHEQSAAARPLR